jgi:hypothetical protein
MEAPAARLAWRFRLAIFSTVAVAAAVVGFVSAYHGNAFGAASCAALAAFECWRAASAYRSRPGGPSYDAENWQGQRVRRLCTSGSIVSVAAVAELIIGALIHQRLLVLGGVVMTLGAALIWFLALWLLPRLAGPPSSQG